MGFFSNPFKSIEHFVTDPVKALTNSAEAALPIAGAIGGGILGGPLGAAAGAELGGAGSNLLRGESLGQSLEGALPGAVLSGATAGISPFASDYLNSTFPDTMNSLGLSGSSITAGAGDPGSSVDPSLENVMGNSDAGAPAPAPSLTGSSADQQFLANAQNSAATAMTPSPGTISPPATPGFIDSLSSGNFTGALKAAGSGIANNPGLALSAGGIALNALKGNKETGAEKNQAAYAGQEAGLGNSQIALGTAGQLAPGQQAAIEQQLQSTISQIKSQYAGMGMSGSTSEQQAIAQARQQASATIAQQAQQEINTGLSALGQGSAANAALVQQQMQSNPDLTRAILALNASNGVTSKQPNA